MGELGSSNIVVVETGDDLKTILACFKVNQISHVPVLDEGKFVGMVSKTDVVEYLHDHMEKYNTSTLGEFCKSVKAKEVMVQPLVEATTSESEMSLMERLFNNEVSSVIIRDEEAKVVGLVTEKDMIRYLCSKTEDTMSLSEKVGLHVVQWLDKNGIVKLSRVLADIGI